MLYLKQKSPVGIKALSINKRDDMYKVKRTTWTNMQNWRGGGKKMKLLYRRRSSFLQESVVTEWMEVRGNVPPYGCRRSAGTVSLRSCGAFGGGGCDQEEKEAAVLLTVHQR